MKILYLRIPYKIFSICKENFSALLTLISAAKFMNLEILLKVAE